MIFGIRITTPWRYLFEQWRCRIGLRNVTFWRMVYNHQNQTTTTIVAWPKNTFTYNSKCGTCLCTKRRSCPCYSARGKLDVVPSYRLLEGVSYQTVCLNLATPHLCVSRIVSQAFFWNNKHFPSFPLLWLYKILAWMTGWYCDDSWNILFYGFLQPCQLCSTFSFHNFCWGMDSWKLIIKHCFIASKVSDFFWLQRREIQRVSYLAQNWHCSLPHL